MRPKQKDEICVLAKKAEKACLAAQVGPRLALARSGLVDMTKQSRKEWLEEARIEANMVSYRRSIPPVKSGTACF